MFVNASMKWNPNKQYNDLDLWVVLAAKDNLKIVLHRLIHQSGQLARIDCWGCREKAEWRNLSNVSRWVRQSSKNSTGCCRRIATRISETWAIWDRSSFSTTWFLGSKASDRFVITFFSLPEVSLWWCLFSSTRIHCFHYLSSKTSLGTGLF